MRFVGPNQPAIAAAAITAFRFVTIHNAVTGSTAENTKAMHATSKLAANTGKPMGISDNTAASGSPINMYITGSRGRLEVDGSGTAIVAGDMLTWGTGGIGVKAATGEWCAAIALDPATVAGARIRVTVVGFIAP